MRFIDTLPVILGFLDLGVHGAPADVTPKQGVIAQTSGSPPEFPAPEVVKMDTHVKPWIQEGRYGKLDLFKSIDLALTTCKDVVMSKQKLGSSVQSAQPLDSSEHITVNRKRLEAMRKADKTGCGSFLLWFFQKAPKGAHLHVHFNAALRFDTAWDLAFVGPEKMQNPYFQHEIPPGFDDPILVIGPETKMDRKKAEKAGSLPAAPSMCILLFFSICASLIA